MARIGRLAGALLVETEGRYFLVGNTKGPCDFARAGFEPPVEIDALKRPFIALQRASDVTVTMGGQLLVVDLEAEALAGALARRFVIERNGSVSERLWSIVVDNAADATGATGAKAGAPLDVSWLGHVPDGVWQIVRDAVLRCS